MKKAVITGITGQDGAYLSQFLLDKGYEVIGLHRGSGAADFRNLEYLGVADQISLIPADLLNLEELKIILGKILPHEIYNLASMSSVALSFQDPMSTIQFNCMSTLNLLEAIRTMPLKTKFYQASSSEMFGRVKPLPITEGSVLHPVSPYAISKATCHWTAVNYREAYGIFSCCGILFNHESVLRPTNFVTKKITSAAVRISRGSQEKLRLGNIDIRRDWGYAPEYVKVMWMILQHDQADDYIIATHEAHSLREFVKLTFHNLGLDWQEHAVIDQDLYRPTDIDLIYGNPQKVKQTLGWQYNISFEELIQRLVRAEMALEEKVSV